MSIAQHLRRNSLPSLWEQAVELWRDLVLGFGDAALIMRWGVMRALLHRALGHELRDLEAIARRAIREDAETCEVAPSKPRARRPDRRQTTPQSPEDRPRPGASYSNDPASWKVAFRMSKRAYDPTRPRNRRRASPRDYDPETRRPCRGYALRIEALRRVIANRETYVLRYARRLMRIEQARIEQTQGAREEFLAALQALLNAPPEDDGSGLMSFNVDPLNAKHVEPG
jgi:hypothetical protein